MSVNEFLLDLQSEIRAQISEGALYAELIFSELVMEHLAEAGMTFEPVVCHYEGRINNAILKLSGYSVSDSGEQLDLFVSLYEGVEEPVPVSDSDTKKAAQQCLRFLELCATGRIADRLDPSSDAHSLALTINAIYNDLDQIRIYVLTDRLSKSKSFKSREIGGKSIRLEIMDVERLYRHLSAGKPRDELIADFQEITGTPLPCVYVPSTNGDYDYALTAIPGETLRFLYEKYGSRLLEANVRSFLSVRARGVNAGIQATIRNNPERFMAYNNGIVMVADDLAIGRSADGSTAINWLKGMQIVNGGQTSASIYFSKRKFPDIQLQHVRVPAKIIVIKTKDPSQEEALISDISRYANSQNSVRQSDLSANKPYHIDLERLSLSVYCPDGTGRWFYERATGSYATLLSREGSTVSKRKALQKSIPTSRKITKTDVAKYIVAWEGLPNIVSLGAQKCFTQFMDRLAENEAYSGYKPPTANDFRELVAKGIVYKAAHKVIRPRVTAFLANVTAYTVGYIARRYGDIFDFDRVWQRQSISDGLESQIKVWADEINTRLHKTASGRMISEWGKKPECTDAVYSTELSPAQAGIPELKT